MAMRSGAHSERTRKLLEGLDTCYLAQNKAAQTVSPGRGHGARPVSGRDALARLRHHRPQLLAGLEGPKPADLNVMLLSERRFYRVQEGIDDTGAVLLRNEGTGGTRNVSGDLLD